MVKKFSVSSFEGELEALKGRLHSFEVSAMTNSECLVQPIQTIPKMSEDRIIELIAHLRLELLVRQKK